MKTLPLIVISLLLTTASSPALDLDSLLRASVGGQEAYAQLQQISSYRLAGRLSLNDQSGRFTFLFAAPDKVRLEVALGSLVQVQGYDGHTAWQRDFNGAVIELSGSDAREVWREAYLQSYSYVLPDRMAGHVRYVGDTVLEGSPAYVLELYPLERDTMMLFLDKANARPRETVGFMDKVEIKTVFDDYRRIGRIMMPFHSAAAAVSFPYRSEMWVDTVRINIPIDDSVFSPAPSVPTDFSFPAEKTQVTIPFMLVNGHLYIEATVNGSRRFVFILDTGASMNFLHADAADAMGMTVVGELPGSGLGGDQRIPLLQTDSIKIGDLTLYHQVAGKLDLSLFDVAVDELAFGGLIGYDFLSRFPILLDFDQRELTVYRSDRFTPPPGGVIVPLSFYRQVPVIPAEVEGISGDFVIDLGNPRGIILHDDFVRRRGLLKRWVGKIKVGGEISGVGGSLGVESVTAGSFAIGGLVRRNVPVLLSDAGGGIAASRELAGNIGGPFLQQFRVLLDYQKRELRLYPVE